MKKECKIIYLDRCPSCDGKGKITSQIMQNGNIYVGKVDCQRCNGKGMIPRRSKNGN
jgi:DnaJ-class molecular chaperone